MHGYLIHFVSDEELYHLSSTAWTVDLDFLTVHEPCDAAFCVGESV